VRLHIDGDRPGDAMEVPSLLKTFHRGSDSSYRRVAGTRDHPKELVGPGEVSWISFIFRGKYRRGDDNVTWSELRIQPAAYPKTYNAARALSDGVTQVKSGPVAISDHRWRAGYSGLNRKSNYGDDRLHVTAGGASLSVVYSDMQRH